MAVRSRRVFGPTTVNASAYTLLYTVPAGRTLVLRTVTIYKSGGNTTDPVILAVGAGSINNVIYRADHIQSRTAVADTQGGVAGKVNLPLWDSIELNPGDTLYAQVGAGSVVVTGFGSLLLGEPE